METIIRNWTILGALILALLMGVFSATAGVSFFGILLRIVLGVSAYLIVGGLVSGMMGRSILSRMAESEARPEKSREG